MSYTSASRLSRGQTSVAIAGATGDLGFAIASVFLGSQYKPFFSRVIAITRNVQSSNARQLESSGATLHEIPNVSDRHIQKDAVTEALRSVDVVIDVLNHEAVELAEDVFEAALAQNVCLYVPSDFGVDHRLNDFPGYDHSAWVYKRQHDVQMREKAKASGKGMKIVAVHPGLFLEGAMIPVLGLDIEQSLFSAVGSASAKFSATSKPDIGRALAELSILCMSPANASEVPDHIRIAGDSISFEELRDLVQKTTGREVELRTEDLVQYKLQLREKTIKEGEGRPAHWIRALMGEGKMDFSKDNQNKLVNPGERSWKWKTMAQHLQETLADV